MFHPSKNAALAGLLVLSLGLPSAHAGPPIADTASSTSTTTVTTPRLPSRPFLAPQLQAQPSLRLNAQRDVQLQSRLAPFQQRYGGSWEVRWDERADRPNLVQGSGIALIPGRGNALKPQQFGITHETDMNLGGVAVQARQFIDSVPELLQTGGLEFKLDTDRSLVNGGDRPVWFIEFGQYHQGVRVEGAYVYVRIAQGNVVQFGSERVTDVRLNARPLSSREEAFAQAWQELGFPAGTVIGETVQAGELRIYPALPSGDVTGERYRGRSGAGYTHVLVWRYVFRLPDDETTFQVLVDAHSNHVLEVRNLTVSANVRAGIYPNTNTDAEVMVDLPFLAVDNNGSKVTNALGIYDYSGDIAVTELDGPYIRIADYCGTIELSNDADGNLDFGSGGGPDCGRQPGGIGGSGNTHAARSGFYHLSRINAKGRSYFPQNAWLHSKVTSITNLRNKCGALWNGTSFNFHQSGQSASDPGLVCSNPGEIAAIVLHEWGHAMDENSGGMAAENGSGEAVGDTFAFLETRDSCIGPNFRPGVDCPNCVACTGARDVGDFGVAAAPAKMASPANLANNAGINCDSMACPYLLDGLYPYQGPMGYQGHCESYIAGSANWDLTQALVARYGERGWNTMERIWYASLTSSKSAYRVASGGTCNTAASVDGCGAENWYTVYLAADDDDGNLANGTPNACRIWDAFNAHGIACGTRPACSGDKPGFGLAVTNSPQAVCAPAPASFALNVDPDPGFAGPVSLSASGNPAGTTVSFSPNPATPGNPVTLTVATAGAAAGSTTLNISGSASDLPARSSSAQLTIATAAPAAPVLTTPANGATGIDSRALVTLRWNAADSAARYSIEIATDAAFSNIISHPNSEPGTSWFLGGLQPLTTYYWRVRASNICGNGSQSPVFSFRTAPLIGECNDGQSANVIYHSDVEGDVSDWSTSGSSGTSTWAVSTRRPASPTRSWLAVGLATVSDQRLTSPPLVLPAGQAPLTLSFQSETNLESSSIGCYDGGFVEVSTNDGASWSALQASQLLTVPYTGTINPGAGPGAGMAAWCRFRPYQRNVVDLGRYAGQTARLRFRVSTDSATGTAPYGWLVDDIKVQGCRMNQDTLFADGFQP